MAHTVDERGIDQQDQAVRRRKTRDADHWHPSILAFVTAFLMLVGLIVLSYPTAAGWFSQREQSRVIQSYSEEVKNAVPAAAVQLSEAEAYNEALDAGAVLGANTNVPTGSGELKDSSLDYNTILKASDTGLMGRLTIPKINVDLPIYHGTAEDTLLKGIGHLEGTSLPVGGASTHAVLTGHRGLADAVLFTHLDQVGVGDRFTITVFDKVLTYEVTKTEVVDPEDTESLGVVRGQDLVTLVTCTPLGINTQRILVTGSRVTPTPLQDIQEAKEAPHIPGFPWWVVWLVVGVVVLSLYVWWAGKPAKKKRKKDDVVESSDGGESHDSGSVPIPALRGEADAPPQVRKGRHHHSHG